MPLTVFIALNGETLSMRIWKTRNTKVEIVANLDGKAKLANILKTLASMKPLCYNELNEGA